MRRVVDLAWLALLAFMLATWPWLPELVGAPREALPRHQYLALMLGTAVLLPWLAIRGSLLLARHAPALLNMPNKDYWLAPERREQTLAQLDERLAVLSLGLALLCAGVHGHVLLRAHPGWPQVPDAVWIAGGVALGLAFLAWMLAFMRHFGRREPVASPHPVRRRTSRNDELVWRESQPMWLLFPILAGTGLFILKIHDSVATSGPSPSAGVVLASATCALIPLLLGRLVTELRGDSLRWHYGWLGWPRWRVELDDIVTVEPARSSWVEGWGIRTTGEGMLYNSSGTQAVRLTLRDGRRLRLGTRDPQRLAQLLRDRLAAG